MGREVALPMLWSRKGRLDYNQKVPSQEHRKIICLPENRVEWEKRTLIRVAVLFDQVSARHNGDIFKKSVFRAKRVGASLIKIGILTQPRRMNT